MKIIAKMFLMSSILLLLTACGSKEERVVSNFIEALTKEHDLEKAKEYLSADLKENISLGLEVDESLKNNEQVSEYKKFEELIVGFSKQTTYSIKEKDNNFEVTFEYYDLSVPIENAFNEYFAEVYSETMEGTSLSEEESANFLYQTVNEHLKNFKDEKKTITGQIEVSEVDNKLVISKLSDEVATALNYGLGGKPEEQK